MNTHRGSRAPVLQDEVVEIRNSVVVGTLQPLVRERERAIEGSAREEERRRCTQPAQHGKRKGRVTDEVVVERDRRREALSAPASTRSLAKARGRHDLVVPRQVADLLLEEPHIVRGHELTLRIPSTDVDTVVHECDAGSRRREPQEQDESKPDGDTEEPRHPTYESLANWKMGNRGGHEVRSTVNLVHRVERVTAIETLREEWHELGTRAGGIFSTWEWSDAWWRHYGLDRELQLYACRDSDGRLSAVHPLYVWRARRPRVLRFLGHGPGDELGPVHAPGAIELAADGLHTILEELAWDVFYAEQLPGGESWGDLLDGRIWRRESSSVLRVPEGGWDGFLDTRSSNFREQLRRRRRELERRGGFTFRLADPTSLERDLDSLFRLHRARWGSRRTDFFDSPFHRDVASAAIEQGWLRLWLLEHEGRPIAAWHGFHVGSVTSYYQAGRDPSYDRLSVGFLLLAHSIREAIAEGASEYRFGRGDEAFKRRFTDDDPGLLTVALTRGRSYTAAYPVARLAQRMRRRLRGIRSVA